MSVMVILGLLLLINGVEFFFFNVMHLRLPWWQEPNEGTWLARAAKMEIW